MDEISLIRQLAEAHSCEITFYWSSLFLEGDLQGKVCTRDETFGREILGSGLLGYSFTLRET